MILSLLSCKNELTQYTGLVDWLVGFNASNGPVLYHIRTNVMYKKRSEFCWSSLGFLLRNVFEMILGEYDKNLGARFIQPTSQYWRGNLRLFCF